MLPSRVRRWLTAHPLAFIVSVAVAVLALSALVILPQLDAVEIRGITWLEVGPTAAVQVRFGYRLASSDRGEVVVRARAAGGERREVVPVVHGRGESAVRFEAVPGVVAIGIELRPSGVPGWLDGLFAARRRDTAVTEPRSPRP